MYKCVYLLLLVLMVFQKDIISQDVKYETILTIGEDEKARKEYLFVDPEFLVTDDNCNVYIIDKNSFEIRKYDDNGKYIKKFSRQGAGPGEIKSVSNLIINQNKEIMLIDVINARITYFSLDGVYLRSDKLNAEIRPTHHLAKYGKDYYVGMYPILETAKKQGNKFVVYDRTLKKQITSFGHTSIFWKNNDVCEMNMDSWCALYYTFVKDNIFVTKINYDGKMYIFNQNRGYGCSTVEGKRNKYPSYEISRQYNKDDYKGYFVNGFSKVVNGSSQMYYVLVRYYSLGLFNHKDKYIINFLYSNDNLKVEFGADIYGSDGKYLGYHVINRDKSNLIGIRHTVFALDNKGNYYMKDYKNGVPIIRKFKLNIAGK